MANYVSSYSGEQLEAVLALFVNKGLGNVEGIVKRKSDGTFEVASAAGGTVTNVSSGVGLTGGPVTSSGTIKANLNSESSIGTIGTTSKLYAVGVDSNGKLCVNVPWTDTNTEVSTLTLTSGSTAGTSLTYGGKFTLTAGSKTVSFTMPSAVDISGKIDTAGTGLSKSGTTLNHSNSVNAQTTQAVYPIKIDAQGHISAYGTAITIVNTRGTAASGGTTLSVVNTGDMYTWNNKQAALVSGTNIKTINGNSVLGSGDLEIETGGTLLMNIDSTDGHQLNIEFSTDDYDDAESQSF